MAYSKSVTNRSTQSFTTQIHDDSEKKIASTTGNSSGIHPLEPNCHPFLWYNHHYPTNGSFKFRHDIGLLQGLVAFPIVGITRMTRSVINGFITDLVTQVLPSYYLENSLKIWLRDASDAKVNWPNAGAVLRPPDTKMAVVLLPVILESMLSL